MAGHDFYTHAEAVKISNGAQHWDVCADGKVEPGAVKLAVIQFACNHGLAVYVDREKPPSFYFSPKKLEHAGGKVTVLEGKSATTTKIYNSSTSKGQS